MSKNNKYKRREKRKPFALPSPGASPGLISISENALPSKIRIYIYNEDTYEIKNLESLSEIIGLINDRRFTYWVEIRGFKSLSLFEVLADELKINKLVLEDITQGYQRPKFEEFGTYYFLVSRLLSINEEGNLDNEQLSFILTERALFTFQETYEDGFEAVRQRLATGRGNIRTGGSSYLLYALADLVVDRYFNLLNTWSNDLDLVEDRLFEKPDKNVMYDIQLVKRHLISLRRVLWPERDKINDILRTDSKWIPEANKAYFKDTYDHSVQLIDLVESMKEISSGHMDMYFSIISNRMNEIMKVLTVISSVFIPLTFIAGIYGMNFSREDPVTGRVMPHNMPELYQENGYLYVLILMFVIACLQVLYFWRKGWFK